MMIALKGAVLVLSLLGYGMTCKRCRVPVPFCFPVAVSGVTVALYLMGFTGALDLAAYGVLLVGLILLLCTAGKGSLSSFFSQQAVWFILLSVVWLFVITRGVTLSHADDGSHWYRVNKAIFYEKAYPTTPDITYYDYVPGVQIWNSFVQRFIGFSIPNCLFAQGLLNIFFVGSLFAGIDRLSGVKERVAAAAVICAGAVALCCMTVGTYTLTVDMQLGCIAMAALIWVLHQGNESQAQLPAALMLSMLALTKRSGLFFALAVAVWAARRYRWRGRKLIAHLLFWLGIPVLLYLMYTLRTGMVYGGGADSLQGVSIERYSDLLMQKDADVLGSITKVFLYALFIEGDKSMLPLTVYSVFAAMYALYWQLKRKRCAAQAAEIRQGLLGTLALLLIYIITLYVTYLLSMTNDEALRMSSFSRYYGTAVLIVSGVSLYLMTSQIAAASRAGAVKGLAAYLMLCVFCVCMPGAYSKSYIFGRDSYRPPQRYHCGLWEKMEYYIPQQNEYSEDRYLVFWEPSELYGIKRNEKRVKNAIISWVRSTNVDLMTAKHVNRNLDQQTLEAMRSYDYVVFMTKMTKRKKYLEPYLPIDDYTVGTREIIIE